MNPTTRQQELVDDHFDVAADYWKALYEAKTVYGVIHQARMTTALSWVDELALPRSTAVLELGCGAGLTSVALAERGYAVTATDNAPAMVDLTNQLARDRALASSIRASAADVHDLPFEDGSFGVALALGVLPWLHSPDQAIQEIARVLRPGGYMLANVDNFFRLHRWLDPRLNPTLAPVRDPVRTWVRRIRTGRVATDPKLVRLDRPHRFDVALSRAGLAKMKGTTIGFGPFTVWARPALSEAEGIRLHHKLQDLADRRVPVVRDMGAQYLVLARKAEAT